MAVDNEVALSCEEEFPLLTKDETFPFGVVSAVQLTI